MRLKIDVRYILFFYLALASVEFFRFKILPQQVCLLLKFSGVGLMFVVILLDYIYLRQDKIKHGFNSVIAIFFIAIFTSTLSAYIFHGQNIGLTTWAEQSVYYYLLYYFLHIIKLKPEELNRLLVAMGFVYLGLYLLQYVIFPTTLFNFRIQESRGTVRIFLFGSTFLAYAYFYHINKFYLTNNYKNILFALALFLFYILNGSRSSLFIMVLITALSLVFSKKVKSRFFIIILFIVAGISFFIAFKDIFMALIEVSNEQINQEDENIRIRAMRFFMTRFQPNNLTYILGNGMSHQASNYGLEVYSYKVLYGFYQTDIGIVGELAIFGGIFIIASIISIVKILTIKLTDEYRFFRFFMIDIIISISTGASFSIAHFIVVLVSMFYIIDYFNYQKSIITENITNE